MSRASVSGSGTWYDHLPFVLLGMRTSVREDSLCSPADLLYGAPLKLPGDMLDISKPVPSASDFARQLQSVLGASSPMPVLHHGGSSRPSRINPLLRTASHVFLRVDAVRRPLVPPYLGPFPVVQRGEKTFKILQNNQTVTVSIDRVKPARLLPVPSISSPAARAPPVTPVPANVLPPDAAVARPLRSGRVPCVIQRFQA